MCVQVTKRANRFEISSLLEKILLKQVRWCLTFVGLYIIIYYCFNCVLILFSEACFDCFIAWTKSNDLRIFYDIA